MTISGASEDGTKIREEMSYKFKLELFNGSLFPVTLLLRSLKFPYHDFDRFVSTFIQVYKQAKFSFDVLAVLCKHT